MKMREVTRIPLEKSTRAALKAVGQKGETYDAVIRRLLTEAKAR